MLWQGREGSSNVDDRRGMSGGKMAAGGGIGGIILYLLYTFLGGDPNSAPMPPLSSGTSQTSTLSPEDQAEDDKRADFVKVVLKDTEDV